MSSGSQQAIQVQSQASSSSLSSASSQSSSSGKNSLDSQNAGNSPGPSLASSSAGLGSQGSESLPALHAPTTGAISPASHSNEGEGEGKDAEFHDGKVGSDSADAALSEVAGTVSAANEASSRAQDAGWAVRPEEMHSDAAQKDDFAVGSGGGDFGSQTGGRNGSGMSGSDGGGQSDGGGGLDGDPELDTSVLAGASKAWDSDLWGPGSDAAEQDAPIAGATGQADAAEAKRDAFDFEAAQSPAAESIEQSESKRRFDDVDLTSRQLPASTYGSEAWHRQVRGTWKLVAMHDPSNDFLPRGATNRFIGIDPDGRRLSVVLTWNGEVVSSLAAEYEVGFRPELVNIQPLPNSPSSFSDHPRETPNGGEFIPAGDAPPCELEWRRVGDRLWIGGAEYVGVDADSMVSLLHQPSPQERSDLPFDWLEGDSEESNPAVTVDFFGVQAEGKFFCYVIDVSGSMDQNGGMLKLRMELERSLSSLPRGTRFAVLPFNHTLRDLQSQWTSANAEKARDLGRRLSQIGAKGGTNPAPAFDWAFRRLSPRPDAIFFMTDGQVQGGSQLFSQLAALNATMPRTRIHTIGLGSGADMRFLDRLARQHGGTSRAAQ